MKKTGILFGIVGIGVLAAVIMLGREGNKSATDKPGRGMESADCTSCSGCSSDGVALSKDGTEPVPPDKESLQSVQSVEKPNLSDPVKSLLLQDGKKPNYPSLLAEINKLNYSLSTADMAALMDMLAWPNDRFPEGMRAIEINAVKNDVLDKLLRQETLPEGIGSHMVEMAQNAENDPVWRDYCIQFMDPCYERLTTEYTEHTEENTSVDSVSSSVAGGELKVIREAMFAALDDRGDTLAGTALIGLENLSRSLDEFDRAAILAAASEIAADEAASSSCRLTALRMSSITGGDDTTAETARNLVQTGETALLRSAAIVTLGEVGSDADRELLESYLHDENRQIASAANMALAKMDER